MDLGCIGRACRYVPSIDHPKRSLLTDFGRYSLLVNLDSFRLTRYETLLRGMRKERSSGLNTATATSFPYILPAASPPAHAFAVSPSQSQRAAQTVPELGEPRARRTTETVHALYVSLFAISTALYSMSYSDVPQLSNYALGTFPPGIDFGPRCRPGLVIVHGLHVGEGREGQCRRRLMMRCGGGQCTDVEDHDARTTAGGATRSTPSWNHQSTGRSCVFCGRGDSHSEAEHARRHDTALPAYIHATPIRVVRPQSGPCRVQETRNWSPCEAEHRIVSLASLC